MKRECFRRPAPWFLMGVLSLLFACSVGTDDFNRAQLDTETEGDPQDDAEDLPPLAEETLLVSFDDVLQGLLVVDPQTGEGTLAVSLPDDVGSMCSTVFTREGLLYGSAGTRLYQVDPCTGDSIFIGEYPGDASICGMASRELQGLYGLNREDNTLVRIDTQTAELTVIGELGWEVRAHALTWDREAEDFLAVDGSEDRLMRVDPETGASTEVVPIALDIGQVGAEKDPVTGEFYLCTGPDLYVVNVETGAVELRGRIGDDDECNDLGATWIDVPCLAR
jgi:hypothetical protein